MPCLVESEFAMYASSGPLTRGAVMELEVALHEKEFAAKSHMFYRDLKNAAIKPNDLNS